MDRLLHWYTTVAGTNATALPEKMNGHGNWYPRQGKTDNSYCRRYCCSSYSYTSLGKVDKDINKADTCNDERHHARNY